MPYQEASNSNQASTSTNMSANTENSVQNLSGKIQHYRWITHNGAIYATRIQPRTCHENTRYHHGRAPAAHDTFSHQPCRTGINHAGTSTYSPIQSANLQIRPKNVQRAPDLRSAVHKLSWTKCKELQGPWCSLRRSVTKDTVQWYERRQKPNSTGRFVRSISDAGGEEPKT